MLNISNNSVDKFVNKDNFKSFKILRTSEFRVKPLRISLIIAFVLILCLFLPWTQNVQSKGYLTTLLPNQKPQAIQSVISGRLEQWFVREGSFVQAGDTIAHISEVKDDYFDPNLVERTREQLDAKTESVQSYKNKVSSLENQYKYLEEARDLKIEQTKNKIEQTYLKIQSDSIDLIAYQIDENIALQQLNRTTNLYDKGLKSLTELETKKLKYQSTKAKTVVQQNKLLNQKNELLNLKIQLPSIYSQYADKLSKSESDKFSALSSKLDASANQSKLQNQLSNYNQRQTLYYITAPQSGYITKIAKKGVGEIIKEGTDVVTIMPKIYDLAVEAYVLPNELPLLMIGDDVRLQFDGWPAVVFSGWPNTSVGVFSGSIIAIDQSINDEGKYRILIAPSNPEKEWPNLLRVGSGTRAFILLKEVPIWYEMWRQLNGFPPDFYKDISKTNKEVKRKAPLKSVK